MAEICFSSSSAGELPKAPGGKCALLLSPSGIQTTGLKAGVAGRLLKGLLRKAAEGTRGKVRPSPGSLPGHWSRGSRPRRRGSAPQGSSPESCRRLQGESLSFARLPSGSQVTRLKALDGGPAPQGYPPKSCRRLQGESLPFSRLPSGTLITGLKAGMAGRLLKGLLRKTAEGTKGKVRPYEE